MQQNMYLQREITAARELYNDTINTWNRDIFDWPTKQIVAAKNGYIEDTSKPVRVATKFTRIAKDYYASINRDIEIIKLNGSMELAPLVNLSDVIVDIVETGTTLREIDLCVYEEIMQISSRLIANKASYKFKGEEIDSMKNKLAGVIAQND
jgi:ATP phosphoribosyltransferase